MLAELVNFENIQAQTFLFNPWHYSEVRWHPEDLNGVKKNYVALIEEQILLHF